MAVKTRTPKLDTGNYDGTYSCPYVQAAHDQYGPTHVLGLKPWNDPETPEQIANAEKVWAERFPENAARMEELRARKAARSA